MIRRNPLKSPVKTGMRDDLPDAKTGARAVRPRLSASLIVIDRSGSEPRFLIGRRHDAHAFMPGKFVFPGGKLERADSKSPGVPLRETSLGLLTDDGISAAAAHALAIAAVREAWEEAAISVTSGYNDAFAPSQLPFYPYLSSLAYVARAITPPGFPRRYDTRFFATFRDQTIEEQREAKASDEMTGFGYYSHAETAQINLPAITRIILEHVCKRLAADPLLELRQPLPTFRTRRGKFVCDWR